MEVAFDTDAFCKLGEAGLLVPFLEALRVPPTRCARLGRLTRQLQRAGWLRPLSQQRRDELFDLAAQMTVATPRPGGWHDRIAAVGGDLGSGEAALFALVADGDVALVVTGDKRALRAAAAVEPLVERLAGRLLVLEQAAAVAVDALSAGAEAHLRERGALVLDVMLASCLRSTDRRAALGQYVSELERELPKGLLWAPAVEVP